MYAASTVGFGDDAEAVSSSRRAVSTVPPSCSRVAKSEDLFRFRVFNYESTFHSIRRRYIKIEDAICATLNKLFSM